jgi:hypothetical protein
MAMIGNDEAAKMIGVSPDTLKVWRYRGRGPRFIKYGESRQSGVAYDTADVEAWLNERKSSSTTQNSPAARLSTGLAIKGPWEASA